MDDPDGLIVQGSSLRFNPTRHEGEVARARVADPEAARVELDGQFRSDLLALLEDELIDAAIERGRPLELLPRAEYSFVAFVAARAPGDMMHLASRSGIAKSIASSSTSFAVDGRPSIPRAWRLSTRRSVSVIVARFCWYNRDN